MTQCFFKASRSAIVPFCVSAVALTLSSSAAAAAPSGVGYREAVSVAVPVGETSNLVDRLLISEGTLNKTGPGTLALATSNLTVQSGGGLVVHEGSLLVQSDANTAIAPIACPLDVLSSAAFWVDATTNVVTVSSNDNVYADVWLDVRETNAVAPFRYTRAVANWSFTNVSPQLVSNAGVSGTLPSVWFGRYNSLRTMTWTTPANTVADITKICHVFAIHGVFQSYGYVFGTMGGDPDFHINEIQRGKPRFHALASVGVDDHGRAPGPHLPRRRAGRRHAGLAQKRLAAARGRHGRQAAPRRQLLQ